MLRSNNGVVRGVQYTVKLPIALAGLCVALLAQTPDVQLRLATAGGQTSFRLGEPIALELSFTSTAAGKYSLFGGNSDRMGMENGREEFRVSSSAGTSDPLADYFQGGMAFNGLVSVAQLSTKPLVVNKDLNQWVRFDQPGRYRVRAVSHRVSAQFNQPQRAAVELESNEIEIELVDDPAWRTAGAAAAARVLRTVPKSGDSAVFQQRMAAARRLWYLDTPESIRESARLLDGTDVQVDQLLQMGLMASSRRPLVIATMEQLRADPAQAVSPAFLDTLARLRAWSEAPVVGPYPADAAAQPAWSEAMNRRYERQTAVAKELQSQLAAELEPKQGRAKAVSLRTLLEAAAPDSISASQRVEMAGLYFDLPADLQSELLAYQWRRISGPAMIPVLRRIYDAVPDTIYPAPGLAGPAVERLYELDPAQGRRLILTEMARPFPRLPVSTLSVLPDATLPDMEEKLMANLELSPGHAEKHAVEELIARYATAGILGRVKAFYAGVDAEMRARTGMVESPPRRLATPACEPPLYAYFLRSDPPYGEKLLRSVMAERSYELGRCWMSAIGATAGYFVNPRWESVAVDGLKDATVIVKIDAVKALGRHGSPAAAAALWEGFAYWHDWWKNKPLEINEENRQLERAYMQTISQANNWIATAADLARAAALCITDGCRGEMEQNRRYWSQPLTASVSQSSDGSFFVSLVQYSMPSLAEGRRRLLQLPKGTALILKQVAWDNRPAPALDLWVGRMRRELQERGVTVAR
jgi:hypothetical protein